MITGNYIDRFTGSGTYHIDQIKLLGSWAHGPSDSCQILYLGEYTNYKCHYFDRFTGSGTSQIDQIEILIITNTQFLLYF